MRTKNKIISDSSEISQFPARSSSNACPLLKLPPSTCSIRRGECMILLFFTRQIINSKILQKLSVHTCLLRCNWSLPLLKFRVDTVREPKFCYPLLPPFLYKDFSWELIGLISPPTMVSKLSNLTLKNLATNWKITHTLTIIHTYIYIRKYYARKNIIVRKS